MAATLTRERFQSPEWVFERKLDGVRVLAFKRGQSIRLLSRNRLPQDARYPALHRAVASLPVGEAVLDGEVLGLFGAPKEPSYHVFDLLWLSGCSLTALSLEERRRALSELPLSPPLALVERLEGDAPWERACREGWEGVVGKRKDSRYEHRRSPAWLKMKCEASQELVVGGFTEPTGRRRGLGALLVGHFEAGALVFAGKVGTGFDNARLHALRERLGALEIAEAPFTAAAGLPRLGVHWVRPELVVQVAFMEWTPSGKLRHPRFVGVREDKAAHEVTRERA